VQDEASVITFAPQDSPPPQVPVAVEQPEAGVHTALQQPPAVHAVVAGVHEQELHTSPVPLQYRVQVPG
jgi:hypothetical protein